MLYLKCILLFTVTWQITSVSSYFFEGIYCGKENCYDVLGVTRDSSKNEIARNYRKLARKYHPDMHRSKEDKKKAEEKFKQIATAYEILRDDEDRADYDYMLDNPEEYYYTYYRYYRRRMAPKVDVRIVLFVTISIISLIQYYSAWSNYDSAIKYFMTIPKYRNKALEIARVELNENQNKNKRNKAQLKAEQDKIIKRVIEENMDIKGAYAKPRIFDILWVQIIILPYTISYYIYWYLRWFWKFTILKLPYGEEEKLYIIRKFMNMGQHQFDALEDEKKEEFLEEELWIKENFLHWKEIEEENAKKALAENNKYKQYRRYMKNHGVGRMTFDDS